MKKIFTCLSLAAASVFATAPAMAQQQRQLTDQEKVAVVKAVLPEILEQMKQISGIDVLSLANPSMDYVLNTPLFGTSSTLRAESLVTNALTIQPDSMKLNLGEISGIPDMIAGMVKSGVVLRMADYQQFTINQINGMPIELNIPKTISTTLGGAIPVSIKFTIGAQTGLLPFSSLAADLDLGAIGNIMKLNGNIFSITETSPSAGQFDYNVVLGESLRAILGMMPDMEATASALPNFLINTNMTQQMAGIIEASLFATPTQSTTVRVPMGDAKVHLNLKAASAGTIQPDSIILTSYKEGAIQDYQKLAFSNKQEGQNYVITTTDSTRVDPSKDWSWSGTTTITMTDRTKAVDTKAIVTEVITRSIADVAATGETNPFSMTVKRETPAAEGTQTSTVLEMDVNTSMAGTAVAPAMAVAVTMKTPDASGALNKGMDMAISLPLKSQAVTVDFTPRTADNKYTSPVGTLYVKSNAIGIITANEAIEDNVEKTVIYTNGNGIQVQNGKGNYQIINMVGRVVATGVITSDNQYISMPNVPNGIYAISIVNPNGRETIKFVK